MVPMRALFCMIQCIHFVIVSNVQQTHAVSVSLDNQCVVECCVGNVL